MVCSSSFASKYKHHLIKRLLSVYQDWGQLSDFFFSCQHQAWIDALFFVVANMVNINLGMEVLNIFHYCMDTTEPFVTPFIACLQDIEGINWKLNIRTRINWYPPFSFAIVLVWIATKQTIGTNFKMSCLVIVTKRCHVIGTPPFPSADCKYTFEPNCWFHIVLSSKQWRQFINCTV